MDAATGAQFPATCWSLVVRAGEGDAQARREALEEICRRYWRPLYAFARRKGCSPPDAEDATQAFLSEILESAALSAADQRLGSLRTFLLSRYQTFLIDTWRRNQAQKRGGQVIHLDFQAAENWCAAELQETETPDAAFERQWINTLLESVLVRVRQSYEAGGRVAQFNVLRSFLNFDDTDSDYTSAASALGVTPAAARQAVHRLRERFSRGLREHIAGTLADPTTEAIDAELAELCQALSR